MDSNGTNWIRLIRNAGSWYEHYYVYDGYTNKGEVLGSAIGPGSNSHYFSLNRIRKIRINLAFEIVDNDNDFYHEAFANQLKIIEDIGKILIFI